MDEACRRFPHLNREEWLREAEAQLHENMTDKEVLQTIIRTTVEKTTAEEPDWQFVAAHLLAHELYMEAAENRSYPSARKYGGFYPLIHTLTEKNYTALICWNHTKRMKSMNWNRT